MKQPTCKSQKKWHTTASMKWFTYLCCVGLGISAFAADEPQASSKNNSVPAGGPQIQFEETKHDFGSVDPQKLNHTFKFKNAGTATLEIKNVQPGCGCTVTQVEIDGKKADKTNGVYRVEVGQQGSI